MLHDSRRNDFLHRKSLGRIASWHLKHLHRRTAKPESDVDDRCRVLAADLLHGRHQVLRIATTGRSQAERQCGYAIDVARARQDGSRRRTRWFIDARLVNRSVNKSWSRASKKSDHTTRPGRSVNGDPDASNLSVVTTIQAVRSVGIADIRIGVRDVRRKRTEQVNQQTIQSIDIELFPCREGWLACEAMNLWTRLSDNLHYAWMYLWSGRTFAIVLGILFALVAIALLVASRTRWGKAKPLTKCVVLSVIAHVWLLLYAAARASCYHKAIPTVR